ncbi:MAG TPA: hypothetical protein DCO77_04845 [Nitrospiraceae bacterium]|nr:hypothetical protein [Nitrospiraceae bacterium]
MIDGKPGFQVLTRQRLDHVDVTFNDTVIRQYLFTYMPDAEAEAYHFGKSLLQRIAVKGVGGKAEFYSHEFSYEKMQTAGSGYQGFQPQVKAWTNASGGQRLTDSEDESKAVSLALDVALTTNYPTFGFQGNYGRGSSTTNGLFMDVDGDGLADRIRSGGGVELNELGADRYSGSFRGASFPGIGNLGSNKQDNFSIGGHIGYWIASANFAYSYNFVNAESMMSDIDGDGYVDKVELSGGMTVLRNDGTKFASTPWNGYGTGHVDFGNDEAATQIKGDFFLSDPVRKWIAPYKGDVRVTGTIQKLRAGGKDDPVDPNDPDGAKASVLAYIYKNNDATPLWTAELPATELSSDSHDLAISVSPGDRLYFRVSSVDDTEADDVSWQPVVTYETACVRQEDGSEPCVDITEAQDQLTDTQGHSLFTFDSGTELRLSGYPYNGWRPGAKGRVRITGRAVKRASSDNVTLRIRRNNTVLWSNQASAESEEVFEHDIVQEVLPGDELTFDVLADTTVDADLVAWQPEIVYEEYCLIKPNKSPTEYSCGPVDCEPDSDGKLVCTIDVPDLPPGATVDEEDLHQYGQVNYPFYYLTPTDLPRFWVAPYDGTVRVHGDIVRRAKTGSVLAVVRGVNSLLWKKLIPAGTPSGVERIPHDFEIPVTAGDRIFLGLQSRDNIDTTKLSWKPWITYSEYCTVDSSTGETVCRPVTETIDTDVVAYGYCEGQNGEPPCHITVCPAAEGPEDGNCRQCEAQTAVYNPNIPPTQCQAVTCTDDPIEGVKDCDPLSLIYQAKQANLRSWDQRYYDEDRADAEAFAGGYRQWHYGDWNGNLAWNEAKIKRTRAGDVPSESDFDGDDYKNQPSYAFVYMNPEWQGVLAYRKPVWGGRGQDEYLGKEQQKSSRVGGNVSAIISGIGVGTIQQSVSKNTAFGVGLGPAGASFSNGDSKSNLDFLDMNGDRFPDQVSQGSVLFNNGVNGFAPQAYPLGVGTVRTIDNENVSYQLAYTLPQNKQNPKGVTVKVQSPGASLGLSYGVSDSSSDLMDINGDGLPDRVSRGGGGFLVSLNLGYRFSSTITWPSGGWGVENISNDPKVDINADGLQINENATYSLGASFWGIGGGASYTVARGITALQDINGDGLADQILKRSDRRDDYFQVKLNRGNGFGDTEQWNAPAWGRDVADGNIARWLPGENDTINYTATESYQLTAGVVIMIPLIPILTVAWIDIAPSVSMSGGEGGSALTFSDINGDGLVDHVLKLEDDQGVYARVNNVGRTNLLKEVRRPLGGKFTLEYELEGNTVDMPQSQWVMRRSLLSDGMGNAYDTRYEYGDGYYDRYEQEFYGFDRVLERHAKGTSIERSITRTHLNRDYYLKNLLAKSVTRDRLGNVWDQTANAYELTDIASGSRFPKLRRRDTYFYDGTTVSETGYKKNTYQTFTYDLYGNVASFFKKGDLSTTEDDVTATITYWRNPQEYIVANPAEILVQDSNGKTLRRRWATYNSATGNMLTLTSLITANQNSEWRMTYDNHGNITTITDPVGYILRYTYDAEIATYITKIQDNLPASEGGPYYSEASYELRFGEVYKSQDVNGNYQVNIYDEFGRLKFVYGPYDTDDTGEPNGTATIAFEFTPPVVSADDASITTPTRAITENKAVSRVGSNGNTLDTVIFVDGMNRMIQTKKEADVNGLHGMTVSGKIVYDDMGRVVEQGQPVFQSSGDLYAYLRLITPLNPEKFVHDPIDRLTSTMMPDSRAPGGYAVATTTYGFGQVSISGPTYFMNTVVDPEGNKIGGTNRRGVKITYRDADDNIVAIREHSNGSPIFATYAYDPLNQITHIKDDNDNTTTVEYDLSGRRIAITNPDTGRTEYDYDANGNLRGKLTANYQRGKEIRYEYVFNRLKKIDYPYSMDVFYEYGAMRAAYNRAGRIKKVTDESGEEERFYGKLGEITKEVKTVNAKTPPVQQKKFTTEYVFDSFGRMLEMVYPDGEKLYYAYDNGGMLRAAWGEKKGNRYDYIKSLRFDEFGQRKSITYGNGITSYYTNDIKTRRLKNLLTKLKNGRTIQNLLYEYDLMGNVLSLKNAISTPTNTALPAGPVEQSFKYDDLYRLTLANGEYTFGPGKQNTYRNEFTYDTIGNMLKKDQDHKIIQPSLSVHKPKETNYSLEYKYLSVKPHAVTDAGDKLYTYDPAGNMKGWTHKKNGTRRTISWSEENRVKQIDDNGKSTYFLYDDSGERVVKRGQHGETIYVNRFYSVRNGQLGTKSVFAGETRVVSKLVKTPNTVSANSSTTSTSSNTATSTTTIPGEQGLDQGRGKKLGIIRRLPDGYQTGVNQPVEKDLFYFHGDHLGSSNMITDAKGAVYQHLEYFPFGETWIEEGGSYGGNTPGYKFTGKELDPETGLYYYGVRYYDPILSKWISADPAMGKYLPVDEQEVNQTLPGMGGVFNPANLGLYSYSHLNPVKFTDPDGEDVLVPVSSRWSNKNDISHLKRYKKNPYLIHKFEVYDYDTIQAYEAAEKSGSLTKPIGSTELSFEARMVPKEGGVNRGTILGDEPKWGQIQNVQDDFGWDTKHAISVTDIGKGKKDTFTTAKKSSILTKVLNLLGFGKTETEGTVRKHIRLHRGGPSASLGCGTSPDPKFRTKKSFERELTKQAPSIGNKKEETFIRLPAKREVEQ